jgi:hypothetical protein
MPVNALQDIKNQFVDITGTGSAGTVTNVTATAPITSTGTGTPNIAMTTPLGAQYGGFGTDMTGAGTGYVKEAAGVVTVQTVPIPTADGGTGSTAAAVLTDGTRPLTAAWSAGNFEIDSKNSMNVFNVLAYGAKGDNFTDDTTAIQNTLNAAGGANRGTVVFPVTGTTNGTYKTTAPLTVASHVRLCGLNGNGSPGLAAGLAPMIHGVHTGVAVINMVDAASVTIENLCVWGDSVTIPKTGLLLGRSSSNGGGAHTFRNFTSDGYFTTASVYSISSEENMWDNCYVRIQGGGGLTAFYTSASDDLSVGGGLTTQSNLKCFYFGLECDVRSAGANTQALYIKLDTGVQGHTFLALYMFANNGNYVTIETNGTPNGGITFVNCCGENIGTPLIGWNLITTGGAAKTLRGLSIIDSPLAGVSTTYLSQSANLTLQDCHINTQTLTPATNTLVQAQIINSYIDLGDGKGAARFGNYGINAKAPIWPLTVGTFPSSAGMNAQSSFSGMFANATDSRFGVMAATGQGLIMRATTYGAINSFDYNAGATLPLVLQDPVFGTPTNVCVGATNPQTAFQVGAATTALNAPIQWSAPLTSTIPIAVPGVIFTQTANKTTTANTLGTLFATGSGTLTLPANLLVAGRKIRIQMSGFVSVADGGASTHTLTLLLGGVSVATGTSGATFTSVLNAGWTAEATITCRTAGAGGTVIGTARFDTEVALATLDSIIAGPTSQTTAAANTTGTLAVDLQFNNGNATGTITVVDASVEILN